MRCSVKDCEKSVKHAGLCSGHYQRKLRHGSPEGGRLTRRSDNGVPREKRMENALVSCGAFLRSCNLHSDRQASELGMKRGPLAQAQYEQAAELVERIEKLLPRNEASND